MKKALTLITLLLVAVMGMAQREGGSAPSIKKNKVMEALISDARSRGMSNDGTYCIDNSKNKVIDVATAEKYMRAKGYTVAGSSTKEYMRFGEPIKILDKLTFFDPNNFHLCAFNRLKENSSVQYSQLKNKGVFFHRDPEDIKYYRGFEFGRFISRGTLRLCECENVMWSGPVVNGLLNGHGVGFVQYGDAYCYFEGDFRCGFPVSGLNVRSLKKDDWTIKETRPSWSGDWVAKPVNHIDDYITKKESIIAMVLNWSNPQNCPAELHTAIEENAKTFYEKDARQIEIDFNNLLPINKNINYDYPGSIAEDFVKLYGWLNMDPKGVLPKAREIYDVQIVRTALAIDVKKEYIYKHLIEGTKFWMTEALKDTTIIRKAIRISSRKSLVSEQSPFRDYYRQVNDILYKREDQIYDNINRQIRKYNTTIQIEKQHRTEMCEKCKIDGSKTTVPEGYIDESWFFGHPAQSEKDGKIVFVNGETVTWRYIYSGYDKGKIEADPSWSTSKTYNDEEEMMKDLIKRCKEHWCY